MTEISNHDTARHTVTTNVSPFSTYQLHVFRQFFVVQIHTTAQNKVTSQLRFTISYIYQTNIKLCQINVLKPV